MSDFGWIPVEARLQELYETVIVTTSTNVVTTAFMTIDRRWVQIVGTKRYFKTVVTAWMPLPKPYKGGKRR